MAVPDYIGQDDQLEGSREVWLYRFVNGGLIVKYTSAEENITVGGETYLAVPITHGKITASVDAAKNDVTIRCSVTLSLVKMWQSGPPSQVVSAFIYRLVDDGTGATKQIEWFGRATNCEPKGLEAEINCEPMSSSTQRTGLAMRWQKKCPYAVFDPATCKLNRDDFEDAITITATTGVFLTISGAADRPYVGGYIRRADSANFGNYEYRYIEAVDGSVLTLNFPFPSHMPSTGAASIYPGCDGELSTCQNVFNNLANNGSTPYIPHKNPYGGGLIY